MGLSGEEMLKKLKHLSQVDRMKQVVPLSYALFPGYHCPLMGAMLTIRAIKNSVMLVLGPDECTYYTKMATSGNGTMSADGCQIVSVVLEQHDVTFGCQPKLEKAMQELNDEYHPKAVFIVTTCVPEVTGDDVESMADGFTDMYGFPVMVVHAENFKTDDHLPGIEHTLEVCIALMKKQKSQTAAKENDAEVSTNGSAAEDAENKKPLSVNVLGLRLGDFKKTELYRVLEEEGIKTGMQLPGDSSVEEIENAPQAAVNIVVHPVGYALARKMKAKFGTPYVDFQRYSDPERIMHSYEELFAALGRKLPAKVLTWHEEAKTRTAAAAKILDGTTYFSGNTALCNYELHSFLTGLGMKPLLLQISDLTDEDEGWRKDILSHCDPYVTRAANIGPLKYLYPVLRPDFNVGAGNSSEMKKWGTKMVYMMQAYNSLGFEVNEMVINAFTKTKQMPSVGKMPAMQGAKPPAGMSEMSKMPKTMPQMGGKV